MKLYTSGQIIACLDKSVLIQKYCLVTLEKLIQAPVERVSMHMCMLTFTYIHVGTLMMKESQAILEFSELSRQMVQICQKAVVGRYGL